MNYKDAKENISTTDHFVKTFLAHLPSQTAATFTNPQLAELKRVFKAHTQRQNYVDMRLSLPVFQKQFYLVFLVGRENHRTKSLQNYVVQPANRILLRLSYFVIVTSFMFSFYMIHKLWENRQFAEQEVQKTGQIFNNQN